MKTHFLIIDTETTMTDKVADFGAIVCDRKGRIQTQAAVLIGEVYSDRNNHPLFHFKGNSFWNADRLESRYSSYDNMVNTGTRMLASASAVNRWLERVRGEYNPILTAYNLAFDASKYANTGIDLNIFSERFCLWHAATINGHGQKHIDRLFWIPWHLISPLEKAICHIRRMPIQWRDILSGQNCSPSRIPHSKILWVMNCRY